MAELEEAAVMSERGETMHKLECLLVDAEKLRERAQERLAGYLHEPTLCAEPDAVEPAWSPNWSEMRGIIDRVRILVTDTRSLLERAEL